MSQTELKVIVRKEKLLGLLQLISGEKISLYGHQLILLVFNHIEIHTLSMTNGKQLVMIEHL